MIPKFNNVKSLHIIYVRKTSLKNVAIETKKTIVCYITYFFMIQCVEHSNCEPSYFLYILVKKSEI